MIYLWIKFSELIMLYIQATNLMKSYTTKPLFEWVDFTISSGQKIALVAKNWAWKSTLLKAIIWDLDLTDWKVEIKKWLKIWFLSQTSEFDPNRLVIDVLFDNTDPNIQIIKQYEELISSQNVDPEKLENILSKIEELKAWEYENKVKTIISKLKISSYLNQTIWSLSWWESKRVSLAKVLIETQDILVLDEPTNHLDLNMIEWLESYFKQHDMTLFLVTHDRYFLERVCNEIWELDRWKLGKYPWNYSYYLEKKMQREEMEKIELHKMKRYYKNELAWINRAPSGRWTKSVYRQQRFEDIKQEYDDKKDLLYNEGLKLQIVSWERKLWSKILVAKKLNKSFWDKIILKDFSHDFKHKERIWIVWDNWVWKSTFVNILMWLAQTDSWSLEVWKSIVFGYYYQKDVVFPEWKRIIDIVRDVAEFIVVWNDEKIYAADLLVKFLFPKSQHFVIANSLSWWEKRRLYLLKILMGSPNFLILDEPTNDLDLITIWILEEFLMQYQWCLIIISHDRFFMDKLVDHIFVFQWDWVVYDHWWIYTEYRAFENSKISKNGSKSQKNVETNVESDQPQQPKKLSYMEKREYENLEIEISQLEEKKRDIEKRFESTKLSFEEISKLSLEIWELIKVLEEKEQRWLELSERV